MKGAGFEFLRVIPSLLNICTSPRTVTLVTSCSLELLSVGLPWSYCHSFSCFCQNYKLSTISTADDFPVIREKKSRLAKFLFFYYFSPFLSPSHMNVHLPHAHPHWTIPNFLFQKLLSTQTWLIKDHPSIAL